MSEAGIPGVVVTPLKLVANEFGRLMEVQRRDDRDFPGFGQVYVTQSFPGIVKAWYRHTLQIDQLAAITGLVKLVLYDDRPDSAARGRVAEIVMGELAPRLVRIPPGVWHGFKALGDSSAFLLHLNSEPYDFGAPDEERRRADDPSIPFAW
ncbi:dTDP-4-dehydrorhamnose 3,5-epimerase [Marinicauda algicola]|uniref:dTDP-4-dehydrorhamnose 3,5-epimerase n=1 Tax=Marinicauda algicola TaxID=2029849 RepID=A0A4S2H084_9PROT|nr:dTDP-4-dehydrorhamnose 3,5-epimerase family protein [Marinicauda algicola]TGY88925.1 dTDP-4-dehydrorhamnose 3,5-epimerase [Marinicauda algicola]